MNLVMKLLPKNIIPIPYYYRIRKKQHGDKPPCISKRKTETSCHEESAYLSLKPINDVALGLCVL